MSENVCHLSPKLRKKKMDGGSQSRMTNYFKPSPEAHVSRRNDEQMRTVPVLPAANGSRKRIICDSPTREAKCITAKIKEIISIDSDTSQQDSYSSLDEMISSPKKPKIAKIAKRPIAQSTSSFKNLKSIDDLKPEPSLKKLGTKNQLVMRTNHSTSTRLALEEKKISNIDRKMCLNVPDIETDLKKKKLTQSINNSQEDDCGDNSSSFPSSPTELKRSFVKKSSQNEKIGKCLSKELEIFPENNFQNSKSEISLNVTESKSSANVNTSKQNKKIRSDLPEICPGPSKTEKFLPSSKESGKVKVSPIDVDESSTDTIRTKCETESEKSTKIPKKTFKRPIVRRSCIPPPENLGLSINSKVDVRLEEITAGVTVSFLQTYKDLETLLDMDLEIQFCSDLKSTLQHPRKILTNSRVNFNFFMNRKEKDPAKDHLDALGSLRCINSYQYPHPQVLHTVIHQIMMVGSVMHILIRNCTYYFTNFILTAWKGSFGATTR